MKSLLRGITYSYLFSPTMTLSEEKSHLLSSEMTTFVMPLSVSSPKKLCGGKQLTQSRKIRS
jgi:hypothetical protein